MLSIEPDYYLAEQINEAIIKRNEDRKPHTPSGFSLSTDLNTCHRKVMYRIAGEEQKPDPRPNSDEWVVSAEKGNEVHALWQNRLIAAGLVKKVIQGDEEFYLVETPLSQLAILADFPAFAQKLLDYNISPNCRPDAIGLDMGIEIKTVGNKQKVHEPSGNVYPGDFDKIKSYIYRYKDDKFVAQKLSHWNDQIQLYMWLLGYEQWRLIIVNRDGDIFNPIERVIPFDAIRVEELLEELKSLKGFVDLDNLPDANPQKGGCKNLGCVYRWTCNPSW